MRHRPIQAAPRERVPFTLWGRTRIRQALATATAAAVGLVPVVLVGSPAYAAANDYLAIAATSNWEGGALTYKLTYTGTVAATFTISTPGGTATGALVAAADPTAADKDYQSDTYTTTVDFMASSVSNPSTATVTVLTNPDIDTTDETVVLRATNSAWNGGAGDSTYKEATATIWPASATPPQLALSAPATVAESAGTVTVVASLSGVLGHDFTMPITTGSSGKGNGEDAVSTGGVTRDYTALAADAAITIPAGQLSGTVNIAINDDNIDEVDTQYFRVSSAADTPAGVAVAPTPADIGITDNEAVPTVSIGDAPAVNEESSATFPIKLSHLSERDLTVYFGTSNGTDSDKGRGAVSTDYTAVSTPVQLTIPALTQTYYQSVATAIVGGAAGDGIIEGTETFTGSISSPGTGVTLGTPTSATATIKDLDTLPGLDFTDLDLIDNRDPGDDLAFDADVYFDEGASGTSDKEIAVTVALGAGTRETPLKIDYSFVDGTATNGVDYKGTSGTLTIPTSEAINSTWTGKIPVTIMGDTTYEGSTYNTSMRAEAFTIKLGSSNSSILASDLAFTQPVYIIEGTDDSQPTWTTSDTSLVEGNEGQTMAKVPVTLSAPLGSDVTFTADFTTPGSATETGVNSGTTVGDNDYDIPTSKNVTIKAGQTTAYLEVPINGDAVYERDEALTVGFTPNGTAVSNTLTADVQHTARVTITGDDAKPTLKINEIAGTEGTTIRATGTLVGVSQYNYTLGVTVAGSGDHPATRAVDFEVPSTLATLSIPVTRGKTALTDVESRLAEFYLMPDDIDEPTETFAVTVSESTAAPQGFAPVSGTFRVTDDPADLPPAASIRDESIGEWEQSVDVNVDLAFDENTKSTTQTVNIPWWTVDGTAEAGEDYEAAKGVLSVKPGDLTGKINVQVLNDKMKENEETFWVKLGTATPSGAMVARSAGEVTIKSEDKADPVTPTLTVSGPAKGVGPVKFMGTAAPNSTVELWGAELPETDPKAFKYLTEVDTDDDGYFEISPRSIGVGYSFVVQSQGINSAVKTVKVTQNPSFSASSSKKGKLSVSVAGNPRMAGQAVTVQRWSGGKWVNVGKGVTTATGWRGTYSFKSKSKHTLRAWVGGNASAGINSGYSVQRKVTIK
jgi:hypothetical protein